MKETPKLPGLMAAVYARKSTEQAVADDQKSVARQIEHATQYATRKGWTVAADQIFVDDGISGAEFAGRPGFVRLMNALKPRPPFQVLVMSEEARLGREAIETAYALKQLVTAGVRVFFYLEDRERTLDSPTDKIMLSLTTFADELERVKARQRTYDAMSRKARAGHVTGGRTFGYRNVEITNAAGERSHVVHEIHADEATIIRRIFELAAAGEGLKAITKRLNADGIASPRPQQGRPRAWAPSSVREILHREVYRGRKVWNKTQKRDAWGQHRQHDRPVAEWMTIDAEGLRIVPEPLWQATHARIAGRAAAYQRYQHARATGAPDGRGVRTRYFLTGFGRCAACGGSMQAVSRSSTGPAGRRFRYCCATYWNRGASVCANGRMVDMQAADRAVHELLKGEVLKPAIIERALDRALELLAEHDANPRDRSTIARRLAALEAELGHLTDVAARGGSTVPALLAGLQARDDERRRLTVELAALDQQAQKIVDRPRVLHTQLRALLADWSALLTENRAEARPLLSLVLAGRIAFQPIGTTQYALTVPIGFDRLVTAAVPDFGSLQDRVASPPGFEPGSWP